MNKEHVLSILKSALIVDDSYKNGLIRDAIELIDPEEIEKMDKEFDQMLEDIKTGNLVHYYDYYAKTLE